MNLVEIGGLGLGKGKKAVHQKNKEVVCVCVYQNLLNVLGHALNRGSPNIWIENIKFVQNVEEYLNQLIANRALLLSSFPLLISSFVGCNVSLWLYQCVYCLLFLNESTVLGMALLRLHLYNCWKERVSKGDSTVKKITLRYITV